MRTVIKITCAAIVLAGVFPAHAETTYFTTRGLLASFFPNSEKVSYRTFALSRSQKDALRRRLGYVVPKGRYDVFVATTGDRIDGYSIVDDEMGQHMPITFATKLSAQGLVERMEIVAYRELRGDEVRDPRFRSQFAGKTSRDAIRLNYDIDAVSGATISCASMAVGVRRAVVLVEELMLRSTPLALETAAR